MKKMTSAQKTWIAQTSVLAAVALAPALLQAAAGAGAAAPAAPAAGAIVANAQTTASITSISGEFDQMFALIRGVISGGLGKFMALGAGVVGLGAGVMMGKVTPAIIGVSIALFAIVGPKVLDGVFGAVI